MFSQDLKNYIDKSVLCWLATCNSKMVPNVSPREIFTCVDNATLLIANIASPESISNIKENPSVCVSFVDVFVQKGYKLKGTAGIIEKDEEVFAEKVRPLTNLFTDQFPIQSVIEIRVTKVDSIKAPGYFLFPETTTEASQVAAAMKTYGLKQE